MLKRVKFRKMALAATMMSLAFSSLSLPTLADAADQAKATLVLKNGIVRTVTNPAIAEAVAVQGGTVVFVGSTAEAEKYVGQGTKVIDLQGKLVTPGLMDGHSHPPGAWTDKLFAVSLEDLKSLDKYVQAVSDFRQKNANVKIITGSGWELGPFAQPDGSNPGPRKEDLDAVVSDIPVVLTSIDRHSVWANSKALELAGITKDTPNPEGGIIERNADGTPRGMLIDAATNLLDPVYALSSELTKEQKKEAFLKFQEEANSFGLTGVTAIQPLSSLEYLSELEKEGKLKMRVDLIYMGVDPGADPAEIVKQVKEANQKYSSDLIRINTVKLFADGVTEGKTAVFVEPYLERAGMGHNHHGNPIWEYAEFGKMVEVLDKNHINVYIHAIGDGAVNSSLNAFEHASKVNGTWDSRHVVTHISAIQNSDIERMGKLNVIADTQPFWFYKDFYYELEADMIGEKRAQDMYPARTMWDTGVKLVSGSDYPPTPDYRPLLGIETGITRNSPYPGEQDTDMIRNASQALTFNEMLQSFTANVAYQMNRKDLGSIQVGSKADFTVFEKDLATIAPKDISETPIAYTIIDGKIAFEGQSESLLPVKTKSEIKINGKAIVFDQAPIIDNGSIQVPVQALFEALGMMNVWNDQTNTITAIQGSTKLTYKLGDKSAIVNGQSITLPVPGKRVNGVPMISVRFVSEAFGASVSWIKISGSVEIATN